MCRLSGSAQVGPENFFPGGVYKAGTPWLDVLTAADTGAAGTKGTNVDTICRNEEVHCESCGSEDPEDLRGSYTDCCNELRTFGGEYGTCRGHHLDH